MSMNLSFHRSLCRSVLALLLVLAMPQIALAKKAKSGKPPAKEGELSGRHGRPWCVVAHTQLRCP